MKVILKLLLLLHCAKMLPSNIWYHIYRNLMRTFFNQISPSKSGCALDWRWRAVEWQMMVGKEKMNKLTKITVIASVNMRNTYNYCINPRLFVILAFFKNVCTTLYLCWPGRDCWYFCNDLISYAITGIGRHPLLCKIKFRSSALWGLVVIFS